MSEASNLCNGGKSIRRDPDDQAAVPVPAQRRGATACQLEWKSIRCHRVAWQGGNHPCACANPCAALTLLLFATQRFTCPDPTEFTSDAWVTSTAASTARPPAASRQLMPVVPVAYVTRVLLRHQLFGACAGYPVARRRGLLRAPRATPIYLETHACPCTGGLAAGEVLRATAGIL